MPRLSQPFRPQAKQDRSDVWRVDCRAWAVLLRSWGLPVRPKFETQDDAEHFVRELDAYFLIGGPPQIRDRVLLPELRQLFLRSRIADGCSAATLRNCRAGTRRFVDYAKTRGWAYVDQIGVPQFIEFKLNQTALGLKRSSVYGECKIVRQLFRFARQMHYCSGNPTDDVMPPAPTEQANRSLTPDELKRFSGFSGTRGPVWRFMLATGCRRSEICRLTLDSFVFDAIPQPFVTFAAKGGRRNFPMSPTMVLVAREFLELAPQLKRPLVGRARTASEWPTDTLLGIVPATLYRWWRIDKRVLGLAPEVNLHTLRHDFATDVVEHSGIRKAQLLLGHANIRTTAAYDHTSDASLVPAVEVRVTTVSRASRSDLVTSEEQRG